jgi:hypothetical protein
MLSTNTISYPHKLPIKNCIQPNKIIQLVEHYNNVNKYSNQ